MTFSTKALGSIIPFPSTSKAANTAWACRVDTLNDRRRVHQRSLPNVMKATRAIEGKGCRGGMQGGAHRGMGVCEVQGSPQPDAGSRLFLSEEDIQIPQGPSELSHCH